MSAESSKEFGASFFRGGVMTDEVLVWSVWILERGADCLHIVQLMQLHHKTPSSLASFKSSPVLPFW